MEDKILITPRNGDVVIVYGQKVKVIEVVGDMAVLEHPVVVPSFIYTSDIVGIDEIQSYAWINIQEERPIWYRVVSAILTNGREVDVWRASDGEEDSYTIYDTDRVLCDEEIVRWRPNPKYEK